MKSGIFIRMLREEKIQAVDICDLTDWELEKFFSIQPKEETKSWAITLAKLARDHKCRKRE